MKKLGFIGGGNMAEALMRGLVEEDVFKPAELIASDIDPARRQTIKRRLKIETTADNRAVVREARAILLAVKPQQIDEVLRDLATVFAPPSGAAGRGVKPAASTRAQGSALHLDRGGDHAGPFHRRVRTPSPRRPRDAQCARDGWSGDGGVGACAWREQARTCASRFGSSARWATPSRSTKSNCSTP